MLTCEIECTPTVAEEVTPPPRANFVNAAGGQATAAPDLEVADEDRAVADSTVLELTASSSYDESVSLTRRDAKTNKPFGDEKGDPETTRSLANRVGAGDGGDERAPADKVLPKDTYSFLAVAPLTSRAFLIACICMFIQIASLVFVALDQFYSGNNSAENKLGVPPYINTPVRISEFLALIIAVICQNDVLWSINLLFRGYSRADFGTFDTHYCRWLASVLGRLFQGLFALSVMFMLVLRAETSKNVLLSFNAVNFISNLSKVLFALSKWGYFGSKIKEMVDHEAFGDVNFAKVATGRNCPRLMRVLRSLSVAAVWIFFFSFWLRTTLKQRNGDYLPSSIFVQLGDDEIPSLGLLSDVYDLHVGFGDARWVAREQRPDSVKQFRYCQTQKFWAFEAGTADAVERNPCGDWIARSEATPSMNVLAVAGGNWQVDAGTARRGLHMRQIEMMQRTPGCDAGHYGPKCEFSSRPCGAVSLGGGASFVHKNSFGVYGLYFNEERDTISTYFIARVSIVRVIPDKDYKLMTSGGELVFMYEHPVYYFVIEEINDINQNTDVYTVYELIVCVGRRWARVILGVPNRKVPSKIAVVDKVRELEKLLKHVEGRNSAFRFVTHLSEPFTVNTLQDAGVPDGYRFFPLDDEEFAPNLAEEVPESLRCSCMICPLSDNVLKKDFIVTYPTSPFFGQNMTCADVQSYTNTYTKGSLKCSALQMESMFQCGCPYKLYGDQHCSLCSDGSPVEDALVEMIPFPDGGLYPQASCGELSIGVGFQGGIEASDNIYYCPAWQGSLGDECGCSNPPRLPCEIVCPVDGHVFDTKAVVSVFEVNESWNGWYCGEIRSLLSGHKEEYCTFEYTTALADVCCFPVK